MAKTTISDYITLAALAGVAFLVLKNKNTLSSIGSGINTAVSGALQKVDNKISSAAKE